MVIAYNDEDPGSNGWVEKIFFMSKDLTGLRPGRVKQFLLYQNSYYHHKPARRHVKRNPT